MLLSVMSDRLCKCLTFIFGLQANVDMLLRRHKFTPQLSCFLFRCLIFIGVFFFQLFLKILLHIIMGII